MINLGKLVQACRESTQQNGNSGVEPLQQLNLNDPIAVRELRRLVELRTGGQELERLLALIRDMNNHLLALAAGAELSVLRNSNELTRRACCVLAIYETQE